MIIELSEYYWNLGRDFSTETTTNQDIFLTHVFITNQVVDLKNSNVMKVGDSIHNISFISSATDGTCLKFISKLRGRKYTLLFNKV